MGVTTDGSKILKFVVGLACALLLAAAVAAPSGAPASGGQAKLGKKCGASVQVNKANRKCGKRKTPKLTRAEAVNQALRVGRIEAQRAVAIGGANRTGRSTFSVEVIWTKRPPLGTQDCSLDLSVRKKSPRMLVTGIAKSGCEPIKEHKDFKLRFQTGPGPKYCPSDVENSWDAKPAIEGLTLNEAELIAAENGCEVRVARQDGIDLAVTMDFSYNRLNVEVDGPDLRVTGILGVF